MSRAEVAADYSYARLPLCPGSPKPELQWRWWSPRGERHQLLGNQNESPGLWQQHDHLDESRRWVRHSTGNLFTDMFGPQTKFRTPRSSRSHNGCWAGACTTSGSPASLELFDVSGTVKRDRAKGLRCSCETAHNTGFDRYQNRQLGWFGAERLRQLFFSHPSVLSFLPVSLFFKDCAP